MLWEKVSARLDRDPQIRRLGRYDVAVADGRTTLTGHVRSRQLARGMDEAVQRVEGVSSVENRLVADDELELQVASAIGHGALSRGSMPVVRVAFGQVRIGGVFTSPEARRDAVRIGAGVPGVVDVVAVSTSDLGS